MRDLFVIDLKNYNPDGKVFSRPSVRGVVIRDSKVLLMYSQKYDYYKFPGGGIEKGETNEQALIREVQEESGYIVVPKSIEEYGRVLRRQKDSYDDEAIFEQENLYYFCDVCDETVEVNLDDYEAEEGFTPVWMDAFAASNHNRYCENADADLIMVKREQKVLDMVDIEIRSRERKAHENKTIEKLGNPLYKDMLDFVDKTLGENVAEYSGAKTDISYSRFAHTKRVLSWALRLYDMSECKDKLDFEDIVIATIFHDVGRSEAIKLNIPHAHAGVPITREYLLNHGYDNQKTEYICSLVEGHSDKYRMTEPDLDKNLLLLMEADLLDDMGALGVVMDCMITVNRNHNAVFSDCLDHISRYTLRQQQNNPMVSVAGRKLWDEKTRVVTEFTDALKNDIEL